MKPLPSTYSVSDIARFQSSYLPVENGCWPWIGEKTKFGYGVFYCSGERFGAHRVSFHLNSGTRPDQMVVCHKCDNRLCVNPEHLFVGSQSDNIKDQVTKGRHHRKAGRGERHRSARLDDSSILEIRRLYAGGEHTTRSLATRFRVSHATIFSIISRKTWRHI